MMGMMMDYQSVHTSLALVLLALGMGYLVCAKAHDVDCKLGRFVGKLVGWFIMIVAIVSLTCMAMRCLSCYSGASGKACPRVPMPAMPDADAAK